MSIIHGDCLDVMKEMESNSISAIVTDPPYGLKFMGKNWDHNIPGIPFWEEALRISKPGSYLLSFGGTRTFHRLTCAIEDAGWKIRDCMMWLYGSGFPKSNNHFGIEGYGTALKPAWEPIIMAMKKCEGTFKQNAEKWEQAGINIDDSRIETDDNVFVSKSGGPGKMSEKGRWPANVLLDEEAASQLDGQDKVSQGSSRFFYCTKSSSSERNKGLDHLENKKVHRYGSGTGYGKHRESPVIEKNNHPTIKPLKLMKYLITLIMPPTDGILLDPFAGSGSTILAAHELGHKAIGIEKCEEYAEIARERLKNDNKQMELNVCCL